MDQFRARKLQKEINVIITMALRERVAIPALRGETLTCSDIEERRSLLSGSNIVAAVIEGCVSQAWTEEFIGVVGDELGKRGFHDILIVCEG